MVKIWTPFVGSVGQFRGFRLSFWRPGSIGKLLLPEGLLCKRGLKTTVRPMSVVCRLSSVCNAQTHSFARGIWRWNMPEATGVLPENA